MILTAFLSEKLAPAQRLPGAHIAVEMSVQHILAVVQSDLQYICSLRRVLETNGFPSVTIARNSQ